MRTQRAIKAQTSSELAREETFMGIDYIVVPVIAMVEGVRFGANQTEPELGLSTDFGKYPETWDQRPLVVNHPKISGVLVSANKLQVVEEYAFGFTNNTAVIDGKLHMEAWINSSRASEVEGVQDFLDKIANNEMIEVSVGFYADVEASKGKFKGQSYGGIWRNLVPDHLAFLTDVPGACSVADGCGVPRINQANTEVVMGLKSDGGDCGCGCGGSKKDSQEIQSPAVLSEGADNPEKSATTTCSPGDAPKDIFTHTLLVHTELGMTASSVHAVLREALRSKFGTSSCYIQDVIIGSDDGGMTAIFEIYLYDAGYVSMGIHFTVDSEGRVDFTSEPFEVRIVSKVYTNSGKKDDEMGEQANPTPQAEAPKVHSRAEALALMSAGDRADIEAAVSHYDATKANAIATLMSNPRNKLTEEFLKAQSMSVLDQLVEMTKEEPAPAPTPAVTQEPAELIDANGQRTFAARPPVQEPGDTAPQVQSTASGYAAAPDWFSTKQ